MKHTSSVRMFAALAIVASLLSVLLGVRFWYQGWFFVFFGLPYAIYAFVMSWRVPNLEDRYEAHFPEHPAQHRRFHFHLPRFRKA